MQELVLYDFSIFPKEESHESYSPFCLKVSRALRLGGLSFSTERISPTKIKKYNPLGQLPVLRVGKEMIWDSTRILRYIDKVAPENFRGGLRSQELAEAWLWEEFGDTCLYPFCLACRWADDENWQRLKDVFFADMPVVLRGIVARRIRESVLSTLIKRDFLRAGPSDCWERFHNLLRFLNDRAPETGFWLGKSPSFADVSIFASLHSLRIRSMTPREADELDGHSRLSAYLDRVHLATAP